MEEMVQISEKEYKLLKKHQKEYGILLEILANEETYLDERIEVIKNELETTEVSDYSNRLEQFCMTMLALKERKVELAKIQNSFQRRIKKG